MKREDLLRRLRELTDKAVEQAAARNSYLSAWVSFPTFGCIPAEVYNATEGKQIIAQLAASDA